MDTHPTPTEPESLADLHVQDARDLRGILVKLVDLGAQLAQLVVQQANYQVYTATPSAGQTADLTAAFNGVTRSVRLSMLLAQKLTEQKPASAVDDAARRRVVARKTIIRQVEDSLYEEAPADQAERLRAELVERVERCEFDAEIDLRPIEDIILDIRRDLGVGRLFGHDRYKRRTPADMAILCARAAHPSVAATQARRQSGRTPSFDLPELTEPCLDGAPPIRGP